MYIGEVSKRTGLSVKAIRLYEERGLIRRPQRRGRYRIYSEADIEVLNLISEAKLLGVTLSQLRDVIIYREGQIDWKRIEVFLLEVKKRLHAEKQAIEKKLEKLETCISAINSCPQFA